MMYQPGVLPMPSTTTLAPLLMLLSSVYVGPGPYQQPVKFPIVGGLDVELAVGVAASVGTKVGVMVAVGVGVDAAAVSVKIVDAA